MSVLFFDIGATLADARPEADGSLTFLPGPRVVAVLDAFRDGRKGIISNPGSCEGAALGAASVPGADSTVPVTAHLDSTASGGAFVDAAGEPRGAPARSVRFVLFNAVQRLTGSADPAVGAATTRASTNGGGRAAPSPRTFSRPTAGPAPAPGNTTPRATPSSTRTTAHGSRPRSPAPSRRPP
ncbi:hypothetical protein ACFYWX_31390 [Streptomyces sp. NPDC002888]|uniref:hypothetical protein n=1 Tax=Streptomyces sp. NPDC002888 TaxID=3364668 RepID=UPI003698E2DC